MDPGELCEDCRKVNAATGTHFCIQFIGGLNMKKDIVTKVNSRIDQILADRANELNAIDTKIREANEAAANATKAMDKAADSLSLVDYDAAKRDLESAKTALQMLTTRKERVTKRKAMSEHDSDEQIDQLLEYEKELAEQYKADLAVKLTEIRKLQNTYRDSVERVEAVISRWTADVHPNYRSECARYANGTNRAETPQPVHIRPYSGCEESDTVAIFLKSFSSLLKE